ncbi:MAG: F0F1 ATP synthase subunit A [Anaerolineaceae bacterium]
METKKKWRWGKYRWILLGLIVLNFVAVGIYKPIQPHIQVAPEFISGIIFTLPVIGDFRLTNTLLASFVGFLLLMIMAFAVKQAMKSGEQVPHGLAGAIETVVEMLYNLTESTAGKHAKKIFPWFATIIFFVLVANWMELIPGVDSIGWLEHSEYGYPAIQLLPNVEAIVHSATGGKEAGFMVVPWLRVPSTDLNFTVALALIAVVMTQVFGFQAHGLGYLLKFFNVRNLFKKPFFGAMDFLVSLLELISELAKILSFSFRLFGNIFAGSVLLFLVGAMVPWFVQSMVLFFEFAIGLIQALVFGMLTLVFMTMAMSGHGESEEAH